MRNPKTFSGATPYHRFQVIDKSHPDHEMPDNGTRTSSATPYNHSGKIAKSSTGRGDLAHNGTRTEMLTPASHFKKIEKSMPAAPRDPKKWHKRYLLDSKLGG